MATRAMDLEDPVMAKIYPHLFGASYDAMQARLDDANREQARRRVKHFLTTGTHEPTLGDLLSASQKLVARRRVNGEVQ